MGYDYLYDSNFSSYKWSRHRSHHMMLDSKEPKSLCHIKDLKKVDLLSRGKTSNQGYIKLTPFLES